MPAKKPGAVTSRRNMSKKRKKAQNVDLLAALKLAETQGQVIALVERFARDLNEIYEVGRIRVEILEKLDIPGTLARQKNRIDARKWLWNKRNAR